MNMDKLFKIDPSIDSDDPRQQKLNEAALSGFGEIFLSSEWGAEEPSYGPELDKYMRRVKDD